ncbi:MAG TPA: peptidoglycan-binding protein [Symbiobacteriaceae bacterium]|nr:peptidoglycan-binding protein [Symbiobacteriaceae bacterium]
MKRTLWLWLFALTLIIVIPGVVAARSEALGETALSKTLVGRKALRLGDRGPAVAALQQLLQDRGFDPVKVDGIYGPLTEAAVKEAQAALGLTRDGLAGVRTAAALEGAAKPERPAVVTADDFHAAGAGPRVPSASLVLHEALAPAPAKAGTFALTFNGVPDAKLLPVLLDRLKEANAVATFFVTAETAEMAPDQLALIAGDGHEIGLSGQPGDAALTERQLRQRFGSAQRAIAAAVGKPAAHFRPARGVVTEALAATAAAEGMEIALWTNVTVTDHPDLDPGALAERLAGAAYQGSVLMVHQDRQTTVAALGPLLDRLAKGGLRSVAMSDLARP